MDQTDGARVIYGASASSYSIARHNSEYLKIIYFPLSERFPNYTGGANYDKGVAFIREQFLSVVRQAPTKRLMTFTTCMNDAQEVKVCMEQLVAHLATVTPPDFSSRVVDVESDVVSYKAIDDIHNLHEQHASGERVYGPRGPFARLIFGRS